MLKKIGKALIIFSLACTALTFSSAMAADPTCESNNKVLLPAGKVCCCQETLPKTYACKPTDPVDGKKCPQGQLRLSTKDNDTCICKFTRAS